jgi:hypothetical protein
MALLGGGATIADITNGGMFGSMSGGLSLPAEAGPAYRSAQRIFTLDNESLDAAALGSAHNAARFERLKESYRTDDPWVFDINNPAKVWGLNAEQLSEGFQLAGYNTRYTQSRMSASEVFSIDGHPDVAKLQFTPAGGRTHEGQYYKFTLHDGSEIKVVDPQSYSSGTITPETTIFNPSGQQLTKINGNWIVK